MKLLFASLLLITALSSNSQDTASKKTPLTKLEKLAAKEGAIIKKEFTKFGSVRDANVEFLTITDVSENVTAKGLRLSVTGGNYIRSSYSSFLDADEINGLIKFIEFAKTMKELPAIYTEYNYRSKDDFEAFIYGDKKTNWTYGIKVDRYSSDSRVYLKDKDLDTLLEFANKAKEMSN